MTMEKAIEILEVNKILSSEQIKFVEAADIAIAEMKKAIAQKPIHNGAYAVKECPYLLNKDELYMRKLKADEMNELRKSFGNMSIDDVNQIADIFYNLKDKGDYRLKNTELDSVNDYIEEYCNSWYRYKSFEDLVESEKEQGESYGWTEKECYEQVGKSIFKLKSGWYVQCVY